MFTSATAIFSAGSSFQWLRDNMCVDIAAEARASGKNPYEAMTALAASVPAGSRKLLLNPSLAGGSSLDASPHIRGALVGLDLGHTRADVIRAAMEGIALNLRLVLDELRKLCDVRDEMVAVGGISRSAVWRQILADAMDIRLVKTSIDQQAGSLGAAAVAAVGSGLWPDFGRIEQLHEVRHVAWPAAPGRDIYRQLLPVFRQVCQDQARLGDMLAGLKI
jgi:xylulokinase